MNQSWTSVTIK